MRRVKRLCSRSETHLIKVGPQRVSKKKLRVGQLLAMREMGAH